MRLKQYLITESPKANIKWTTTPMDDIKAMLRCIPKYNVTDPVPRMRLALKGFDATRNSRGDVITFVYKKTSGIISWDDDFGWYISRING